jgi:hypothetical protein
MIPASMGSPRCHRPVIRSDGSYESVCLLVCLFILWRVEMDLFGLEAVASWKRSLFVFSYSFDFSLIISSLTGAGPWRAAERSTTLSKKGVGWQNYQAMKRSMCFCTLSQVRNRCDMRISNTTTSADCGQDSHLISHENDRTVYHYAPR